MLSLGKEYWMGLDNIFKLTNRKDVRMQLRIDLEYDNGQKRIMGYDNFSLETQVCKLLVSCSMVTDVELDCNFEVDITFNH